MDYMFLLYADEQQAAQRTPEQLAASMEKHWAIFDDARARGVFKAASPLAPTSASITVRNQGGRPVITDGPFVETKEALGGFYLLDCKDVDEAKYWANRIAQTGCVSVLEVRAVREVPVRASAPHQTAVMANA